MTPKSWTGEPPIITLLKHLQTLSVRLARLEAAQQVGRTAAVLEALQPRQEKP